MTDFRYIRRVSEQDDGDKLFANEVVWLRPFLANKFYQLPADFKLHGEPLFKSGAVVGMDAASAATVWALKLEPTLSCLDLCCAPGMKLALIEEVLPNGTLFGTDVSENRLRVCRNLLAKYNTTGLRDRIFMVTDETNWSKNLQHFESVVERKKKRRKRVLQTDFPNFKFDRVLVDVECTHDGSDRHLTKGDSWKKQQGCRYDTESKMEALICLQKKLIVRGFNLCKPGGILVYSTCSLDTRQNSNVVEYLLREFPDSAIPDELPFDYSSVPATRINAYSCLFDPKISQTSGQFIAIVRKKIVHNGNIE